MKIEKISNQGLKNDFLVTFPANLVLETVESLISQKAKVVRIDGFRPGKVPANLVRQKYGQAAHEEAIDDLLNKAYKNILKDHSIRPATSPAVNVKSKDLGEDFVFELTVESLPEIKLGDFKKLKIDKMEAEITDTELKDAKAFLLSQAKRYVSVDRKAKSGDVVIVNLISTCDGKPLKELTGSNINLIAGKDEGPLKVLQEALVGKKTSEQFDVDQEFANDFSEKKLAGKIAKVHVEIVDIKESVDVKEIDEQFLKERNMQTEEQLHDEIRRQLQDQHNEMTRLIMKRQLLDLLDSEYQFDTPASLVENEFNNIWQRLEAEVAQAKANGEKDVDDLDDAAKAEYQTLAERRVRLGLMIGEVAKSNKLSIPEAQVRQLIFQEAMKFPGQEKQVLDYLRSRPHLVDQLKAPALEDLVVDFIIERATLNTKIVSLDDLKVSFNKVLPSGEGDDEASEKKPAKTSKKKAKPTE